MKNLKVAILYALLIVTLLVSINTYLTERSENKFSKDLVELSLVKYGLFNVDEWKAIVVGILETKIYELRITKENKNNVEAKVEDLLNSAITDFEERFYKKKAGSISGLLQGGVASLTGMFSQIKEDIPLFAKDISNFLEKEDNREEIKNYLTNKLEEYSNSTFSDFDYTHRNKIISKYKQNDLSSTLNYLNHEVDKQNRSNDYNTFALIIIFLISTCFLIFENSNEHASMYPLIGICLTFLILGIALPMIELDARIQDISFTLLSYDIQFQNQVLFYQSKSILDVVTIMTVQGRIELILVGAAIFCFSVIFPLLKLLCSIFYIHKSKFRFNKFISFMVFKSGKWSMADVMVISIFMAFLGFNGVLSGQLQQLENFSPLVDVFTTNKSQLMLGFYIFTLFVSLGLMLSWRIQRIPPIKT
tara:strand:+ start:133 stop:1389 length:1257 start_codon:yes stop_codon:yes gene_type:complete